MLVSYENFPIEEQAAFRRACAKLGIDQADFDLEAEVETAELAGWRSHPHLVIVTHRPSTRSRLCTGWSKRSWISAFDDQVRKFRFLSPR